MLENAQISNSTNIRPVGDELLHAVREGKGGRMDMTKPMVAFRNVANASKKHIQRFTV